MTKKQTKSENKIDAAATDLSKDLLHLIEEKRKQFSMPNYLVEYAALRHIVDQYEKYIHDLLELGVNSEVTFNVGSAYS